MPNQRNPDVIALMRGSDAKVAAARTEWEPAAAADLRLAALVGAVKAPVTCWGGQGACDLSGRGTP